MSTLNEKQVIEHLINIIHTSLQELNEANNLYGDSDFRTGQIYAYAAGILKETDEGYSFKYDGEYAADNANAPVSLTLPLREEEYTSKWLFPFFDGLIPEGWLLNIVTHNWKLDSYLPDKLKATLADLIIARTNILRV